MSWKNGKLKTLILAFELSGSLNFKDKSLNFKRQNLKQTLQKEILKVVGLTVGHRYYVKKEKVIWVDSKKLILYSDNYNFEWPLSFVMP